MDNLQIFKNKEFGEIRTVTIDDEPWFVGKDVSTVLGYSNVNKAVAMHVDEYDKKVLDFKGFSQNRTTSALWSGNDFSNKIIINESGLYALIFGSKLESAKRFKRWVTSEVLPAIRKTGGYKLPQTTGEMIKLLAQGNVELSQKIDKVDKDLQDFKQDMPILGVEESKITSAVRRKGVNCLGGKDSEAYKDNSLRGKVYADIYGQLKREFGVATYKAIKRNQCDQAVAVIDCYQLPIFLEEAINDCNAQMSL